MNIVAFFSRNPLNGENQICLDQDGIHNRLEGAPFNVHEFLTAKQANEEVLHSIIQSLERQSRSVIRVEFSIEINDIKVTQITPAILTARASVRAAVDMVSEGLITPQEALHRVTPEHVEALLHACFDDDDKAKQYQANRLLTRGVNASPGACVGVVMFDLDRVNVDRKFTDEKVIYVCSETKSGDIGKSVLFHGLLTTNGGATSHAALVGRQLGIPCVVGVRDLVVDPIQRTANIGHTEIREGDIISIDGSTGEVFNGKVKTIEPDFEREKYLKQLLEWADIYRTLKVRVNADSPVEVTKAKALGAEGIGVCRTEHMFLAPDRLEIVQNLILSSTETSDEEKALETLLPLQKADFVEIFKAMSGFPVVVRLLDIPLHEFLPNDEKLRLEIVEMKSKIFDQALLHRKENTLRTLNQIKEVNPMLGFRGIRFGIMRPKIYRMQVQAIMEAAYEVTEGGYTVYPEIMIPLTALESEMRFMRQLVIEVAEQVLAGRALRTLPLNYKVGTMIELPRAAHTANKIAQFADFFSFGTNDLTQTTFGISRDDAEGKFLLDYISRGFLSNNPFQVLDEEGVGSIIELGVLKGRSTSPNLTIGICGEHGGDPTSIRYFHSLGLNYVSCSLFRVPVARLAAAQATLSSHD